MSTTNAKLHDNQMGRPHRQVRCSAMCYWVYLFGGEIMTNKSAVIEKVIEDILRREGGYIFHKNDRGSHTNFGVTMKTLEAHRGRECTIEEMKALTRDEAAEIYRKDYIFGPGIDKLPSELIPFVADSAVNHGPRHAVKFLQRACNYILGAGQPLLIVDGAIGPKTIGAAELSLQNNSKQFFPALKHIREDFYYAIVQNDPSQSVFLDGWLNRLEEFV